MSEKLSLSIIQYSSGADKSENLKNAEKLIREAAKKHVKNHTKNSGEEIPHLVCLPEVFNFFAFGKNSEKKNKHELFELNAEIIKDGMTSAWASSLAKELGIYLLAGSILEKNLEFSSKPFNTSAIFSPSGELLGSYRKINMFELRAEELTIIESDHRTAGERPFCFNIGAFKIGLGICFDLRFPELFRHYRKLGCNLILLPSAFVYKTGSEHWEILCKARAIENQCFFAAINQSVRTNCWGHSMILDPWGKVLASLQEQNDSFTNALLDLSVCERIRKELPVNLNLGQF